MGLLIAFVFGAVSASALILVVLRSRGGVDAATHQELGGLRELMVGLQRRQEEIGSQALHLDRLLGRSGDRGRWGEMTLQHIVERAGLAKHIDFEVQVHAGDGDGVGRPDLVLNLPSGGCVPVDSKAVWEHYDAALKEESAERRAELLKKHASDVRKTVRQLGAKGYWKLFQKAPRMVVLFLPSESAFAAAVAADPDLLASSADGRVVIATPTTLIGLMEIVSLGWHQAALSKNAEEIRALGTQLVKRLGAVGEQMSKTSRALDTAVRAHNEAAASLDRKVLNTVRKMGDLGVPDAAEIEAPRQAEIAVRTGSESLEPPVAQE